MHVTKKEIKFSATIFSSLEEFPSLNSLRILLRKVFKVKFIAISIWKFLHFTDSKKNIFQEYYSRKYSAYLFYLKTGQMNRFYEHRTTTWPMRGAALPPRWRRRRQARLTAENQLLFASQMWQLLLSTTVFKTGKCNQHVVFGSIIMVIKSKNESRT